MGHVNYPKPGPAPQSDRAYQTLGNLSLIPRVFRSASVGALRASTARDTRIAAAKRWSKSAPPLKILSSRLG